MPGEAGGSPALCRNGKWRLRANKSEYLSSVRAVVLRAKGLRLALFTPQPDVSKALASFIIRRSESMASQYMFRLPRAPRARTSEGPAARGGAGDCLEPGGLPNAPQSRTSEGTAARGPGDCLEPGAFGERSRLASRPLS
jgi:hypothetical protein